MINNKQNLSNKNYICEFCKKECPQQSFFIKRMINKCNKTECK